MKLKAFFAAFLLVVTGGCSHVPARSEEGTLRIYLARHGQTDWNAIRRLQGQSDIPLNEFGRGQAELLRKRMDGVPLDAIYSSALQRSRDTAAIVAGTRSVTTLPSLNERHLGRFEGLNMDGSAAEMEAEYTRRSRTADDTLDGGESNAQVHARVCEATNQIRRDHREGTVLVVAHGGTNQVILRCLLDLSFQQAAAIQQSNDELYLVELRRGVPSVWKLIAGDKLGEL